MTEPQKPQTFEQLLEKEQLPQPGPEFYEARRKLWLTPRPSAISSLTPPSKARDRLEEALSHPDAAYSQQVWDSGLERVWKGISSGGALKNRLPMNLIIKIIHASWLQDRTWPAGMRAPSSDDDQDQPATSGMGTVTDQSVTPNELEQNIPIPATSDLLEMPSLRTISTRHNRGR